MSFERRTIILVKGAFSRCDFSFRMDRMSMYAKASDKQKDRRKERFFMSLLQGIITRLENLKEQATTSGEVSQRFFEVEGVRMCSVKYFDKTETFELEVYQQGEKPQTYQYDNIDLVAIEIYDMIS